MSVKKVKIGFKCNLKGVLTSFNVMIFTLMHIFSFHNCCTNLVNLLLHKAKTAVFWLLGSSARLVKYNFLSTSSVQFIELCLEYGLQDSSSDFRRIVEVTVTQFITRTFIFICPHFLSDRLCQILMRR